MIWKLLGTLILLGAGGYVSVTVNRFERRRLWVLDGYIALIHHIKSRIDCYAMPIPDILAGADPALIAACLGEDTPDTSRGTDGCGYLPLAAMIRESSPYLEAESERLLTAFTEELGTAFRAEQVARCEYYLEALTRRRGILADALPARLRVGSTLCMCCAAAATILLW